MGGTGIWECAETRSGAQEELADLGKEDAWLRFLNKLAEDDEKEELGEPSRWMLEEILGEQPRNLVADRALFEAEEAGLRAYETDGEREVFF